MYSARTHVTTSRAALLLPWMLFSFACSTFVYEPAPVVPTTSPLPYSATVRLAEIEAYNVEPGATMVADPRIENKVRGVRQPLSKAKKEWERSITDYVAARKTFTYLSADSQTDFDLSMRLNIYVDPSLSSDFARVYVARIDATLAEGSSKRPLSRYMGFGKAAGDDDDRGPINLAVQAALNDLFGKIENDPRLRRSGLL
ncbi:MAG: exported protein of unknown function [Nitrospira sp.]|nr:exported protein of unknown function [Nitrospira sp.]